MMMKGFGGGEFVVGGVVVGGVRVVAVWRGGGGRWDWRWKGMREGEVGEKVEG